MDEKKNPKKNVPASETPGEDAVKKDAVQSEGEKKQEPAKPPKPPADRKCMQKRNGKYYCYRLIQGRWVQASGNAYPSLEVCEAFCYEE